MQNINQDHIDDSQLVSLLKSGDTYAVEYWFKHFKPQVTRYVGTKVSAQADIEEIVQQTFINCLKHLPLFRGNSSIWSWMCSIARHEVADFYRKKYAKKALKTIPLLEEILETTSVRDSNQVAQDVRATFAKMTPKYRNVLQLKYGKSMSVKAIAQQLDTTVKAIESDLYRAREQFKALYATIA